MEPDLGEGAPDGERAGGQDGGDEAAQGGRDDNLIYLFVLFCFGSGKKCCEGSSN